MNTIYIDRMADRYGAIGRTCGECFVAMMFDELILDHLDLAGEWAGELVLVGKGVCVDDGGGDGRSYDGRWIAEINWIGDEIRRHSGCLHASFRLKGDWVIEFALL